MAPIYAAASILMIGSSLSGISDLTIQPSSYLGVVPVVPKYSPITGSYRLAWAFKVKLRHGIDIRSVKVMGYNPVFFRLSNGACYNVDVNSGDGQPSASVTHVACADERLSYTGISSANRLEDYDVIVKSVKTSMAGSLLYTKGKTRISPVARITGIPIAVGSLPDADSPNRLSVTIVESAKDGIYLSCLNVSRN